MNCHCGNNTSYLRCCQLLHTGKYIAKTAEQLMRSRYSAFVVGDLDYLKKTMNTNNFSKSKTRIWLKNVVWQKLCILSVEKGLEDDDEGWVKFKALYKENKEQKYIFEDSYFKKYSGIWYYVGERSA